MTGMRAMLRAARGVTLVEMIVVIAITGIIGAVVAVFIRRPVEGYVDAARRAELTDIADTALRRFTRDLRTALPNSVRVTESPPASGIFYLEYLETRTGGRYRTEVPSTVPASSASTCPDTDGDTLANENVLQFGVADTCLGAIGDIPDRTAVTTSDFLVVYNLGAGIANADAYASGAVTGGNKSLITAAVGAGTGGENVVRFTSHTFTFPSPGRRFHVISGPVTYVCDPVNRTLRRVSGYAIQAAQPVDINAAPLSTAPVNALLASNVGPPCTIAYTIGGATGRTGVVALNLQVSQSGETVRLFQQVHINNVP
ncbi:MAG: prepilin-type N-terminal cleavage/methylation domain-containing protein [Betaproteobacteria bacterium]|nr:prepilin-type N-terminal cleavage/methylation domain-containing protein [Betaproteobacteria bacterium]